MKFIVTAAAIAISITAVSAAKASPAHEYFAQFNDSAAEQIVRVEAQTPTRGATPSVVAAAEKLQLDDSRDGQIFFGGNVESETGGKAQLAASLGVSSADYTLAELVQMRNSEED
ncbi:hypothetical protein [Litoreibacter roseus]|uniref:DUF4148 domain-containing protein n=1 Tax=Litoreibacter roseus TaxID=2601869 RepID=A0A6N6JI79_9RHOB|nr:hypothetical protein [Litoreibacter roseus]GFE64912.1 hypothetical protein KIN_19860 [Litoreibacter roseus]